MTASHKLRAAILLGALAVLALGTFVTPAQAGQPFGNTYCRDRAVFGNTLQFYPTTPFYGNYYRTTRCLPSYNFCPKPVCYPVTLYDCFGRPYVVNQSGYSTRQH